MSTAYLPTYLPTYLTREVFILLPKDLYQTGMDTGQVPCACLVRDLVADYLGSSDMGAASTTYLNQRLSLLQRDFFLFSLVEA